jgi:hypothetical protein
MKMSGTRERIFRRHRSENVRQQPPFRRGVFGGIGAQPKSEFP